MKTAPILVKTTLAVLAATPSTTSVFAKPEGHVDRTVDTEKEATELAYAEDSSSLLAASGIDNLKQQKPGKATEKEGRALAVDPNQDAPDSGALLGAGPPRPLPAGSGVTMEAPEISIHPPPPHPDKPLKRPSGRLTRKKNQGRLRKLRKADAQEVANNLFTGNRITREGCFQGSSSFVNRMCQAAGCCQGPNACLWPEDHTATVCPSACNGDRACAYIGDGTLIGWKSCNGYKACFVLARDSLAGTSAIGKRSCVGDEACYAMCYLSPVCSVEIGNDACSGASDCSVIGVTPMGGNTNIQSIQIEDEACVSNAPVAANGMACRFVGGYSETVEIESGACRGEVPCYSLGYNSLESVEIGEDSCTDNLSCLFLGFQAKGEVEVGEESCQGYRGCSFLGYFATQDVQVGDEACTDYKSCYQFAQNVLNEDVTIKKKKCQDNQECSGGVISACLTTAEVPNKDDQCPA